MHYSIGCVCLFSCHKISPYLKKVKRETVARQSPGVEEKQVNKKNKKKKLYLTFDDGPNKGTKNVIDIIKDEDVPVSFFIVGEHVFASHGKLMHGIA
jgi:peptidoglycan/xylan/chitin deacetylase (PgdA/CDA1 family)